MRLKNNGEQTTGKTPEEFPKDKIEQKEAKIDKEEMVAMSNKKVHWMFWQVLSRAIYNNRVFSRIIESPDRVSLLKVYKEKFPEEEFLIATPVEPEFVKAIALYE